MNASDAVFIALSAMIEQAFEDWAGSGFSKLSHETIRTLDRGGCLHVAIKRLTDSAASPESKVGAAQFIALIMNCRAEDRSLQRAQIRHAIELLQTLEAAL